MACLHHSTNDTENTKMAPLMRQESSLSSAECSSIAPEDERPNEVRALQRMFGSMYGKPQCLLFLDEEDFSEEEENEEDHGPAAVTTDNEKSHERPTLHNSTITALFERLQSLLLSTATTTADNDSSNSSRLLSRLDYLASLQEYLLEDDDDDDIKAQTLREIFAEMSLSSSAAAAVLLAT